MVSICYSCGLDFLCLLLLNLICHANNISSGKDLSDTKRMFAIRDNRKDQDKVLGHMEMDVRREFAPGLHSYFLSWD